MILGVDVSDYQPVVDWELLKAAGVEFVIIKATQGNYHKQRLYKQHLDGANKAGLVTGFYHWHDPLEPYESQAEWFIKHTAGLDFQIAACDVEQQWADWQEWSNGNITKFIAPQTISDSARNILAYWDDRIPQKTVLYTRKSFIDGYAAPMKKWAGNYPLWLAEYPYASGRVTLSWEDFKAKWLPTYGGPALPDGAKTWRFWQFTGDKFVLPGTSTAWDVNFFNGTLAELHQFAGVSIPPTPEPEPEPEQPPEEEPVSMFDQYPKGVMLTNHVADPAKLGGDFIAAKMGAGLTPYTHFHRQVQTAADAGLPLIAVYDNDPLVMIQQYESLNLAKWKAEIRDNRVIKELLGPMIQSGGVNRRIHAVIITMNDIYEAPGKMTDPDWIYQTALALAYGVKTLYGLPVYLSIDTSVLRNIPTGEKDVFATFLSKLAAFDAETGRGYDGVMPGIGTYFNAPDIPAAGTWDAIPAPADSFNTKWSDEKRTSGLGHAPRVNFWCYSAGRVTLPGVGGVAPLYMYLGSKAGLYAELKFTPAGEPEPEKPEPEKPEPEKPQPGSDYSALVEAINANTAQLKRIADYVTR